MGLGRLPFGAIVCAFFAVASFADASVAVFGGTTKKVGGIDVSSQVTLTVGDQSGTLALSGAGVRKKFGVLPLYIAASYVQDVAALRRASTPLQGIEGQRLRVIKLTMAMPLSATQVRESFIAALQLNEVNTEAEPIKSILSGWDQDLRARATAVLAAVEKTDGTQQLVIELPTKTLQGSGVKAADGIWSIWFGKGDSNLEALRDALVGKDE